MYKRRKGYKVKTFTNQKIEELFLQGEITLVEKLGLLAKNNITSSNIVKSHKNTVYSESFKNKELTEKERSDIIFRIAKGEGKEYLSAELLGEYTKREFPAYFEHFKNLESTTDPIREIGVSYQAHIFNKKSKYANEYTRVKIDGKFHYKWLEI